MGPPLATEAAIPPGPDGQAALAQRLRRGGVCRQHLKTNRRDTLVARQCLVGPEALVESELDGHLDVQTPTVQALLDQRPPTGSP